MDGLRLQQSISPQTAPSHTANLAAGAIAPAARAQKSRSTEGSACGKAILVGEHAVVYGARALALPIKTMGMRITATSIIDTAKLGDRPRGIQGPIHMLLAGTRVSEHLLAVAYETLELLKQPVEPLKIEGESSLWIGAGLGSSASLCVGLLRTLSRHYGVAVSDMQIAALANQLEARFHGKPSGLDAAVVALEQVICFSKQSGPTPLVALSHSPVPKKIHSPLRFVLVDSKTRASTKHMVELAAPYFAGTIGQQRIAHFDGLTDEMIQALQKRQPEVIGAIMREAHRLLGEAGVVPMALQELVTLIENTGCLAAKVTGAGGGGSILAMLDDRWGEGNRQLEKLAATIGSNRILEMEL